METLLIEQTDDSPKVVLDPVDKIFEISGKSLPEDVLEFYQPVLDWLNAYRKEPDSKTTFSVRLIYFNTASSKMIMDIFLIFEEMVEEGHEVLIKWHSHLKDEDMLEAGKEFEEMIAVPFEHFSYN
jgi:hypothetical protein